MGDVITLLDGREELLDECLKAPQELRRYLSDQMTLLLQQRSFIDALPGHLPADAASQSRLPEVLRKLQALGQMA